MNFLKIIFPLLVSSFTATLYFLVVSKENIFTKIFDFKIRIDHRKILYKPVDGRSLSSTKVKIYAVKG